MENSTGVLEPTITVKEWMSVWLNGHSGVKGVKYELIVVAVPNSVGDNSSVIDVQNGAEIELVNFGPDMVFELRYVCKPFCIGRVGVELAAKVVLRHIFRRRRAAGTAVLSELDGRLDAYRTTDTKDAFVIDMNIMPPIQLVAYPAVAHIRISFMNFLHRLSNSLVFLLM